MKIEGNRPTLEAERLLRAEQAATPAQRGTTERTAKGDRVDVSSDAQQVQNLAASAVKAASALPDIRPEAVARGRAALESGQLGGDSTALAEAIINDLLK